MDAATAEGQAAEVVTLIQECVQFLRSVEEFAPGASAPLDTVDLSAKFDDLMPRIRQCCKLDDDADMRESLGQRIDIVKRLLWPLLTCLGRCYAVLDQVPTHRPTTKQEKPPPPPGMLSIQNYTDIAVFMEFLVCTSVLPLLQENILPSAQDRARYCLPKSLAGRIPRASLLWGCAVQNTTSQMNVPETILELRTSASIIGQVVSLERFRPMLLFRHVTDLYAAMFQADAMEQQWSSRATTEIVLTPRNYNEVRGLLLYSSKADTILVDPLTQARVYQTLLSRGTLAPRWLRQRVSKLLNELACRDIGSIVHVFVRAGDNMTSASQRLARPLIADLSDDNVAALCRQLVTLLDVPVTHQIGTPLDQNHQARALTVLAVIGQMPLELTMKHFFPLITRDLLPSMNNDSSATTADAQSTHRVVRRIAVLLSSLSPSYNGWKFGRLLLSSVPVCWSKELLNGAKVTVLGQLLRVASIESAVILTVKEDAIFALQASVQTLIRSLFPAGVPGVNVAALALVYTVAPTILDLQGYHYTISTGGDSESDTYQCVTLEKESDTVVYDISTLVQNMERIAIAVVEKALLPLTSNTDGDETDDNGSDSIFKGASQLPSTMFHLLLLCYFSTIASGSRLVSPEWSKARGGLPSVFSGTRIYTQLATMILLPLVCERSSPESLLLTDGSGVGILSMMKLILGFTGAIYGSTNGDDENIADLNTPVPNQDERPFFLGDAVLTEALVLRDDRGEAGEEEFHLPMDDTWDSISSVVLTMLVTMLELGTQKRSDEEESILKSMLPILETLARFKERDFGGDKINVAFQSELAEMAAHAMVLIAARSQMPSAESNNETSGYRKSLGPMESISEAEMDLISEQPPIRARGVALLTRISHRYLHAREKRPHDRPLISIIEDESIDKEDDDATSTLVLSEILRVSVVALADPESYVYLAAIQSIVAAADVNPREIIPMIGCGVASGNIAFVRVGAKGETIQVSLTPEQRIKLSEALLFTIRRRGRAIYEFVPILMNFILHGFPGESVDDLSSGMDMRIQEDTHRYFVRGNDLHDEHRESPSREDMDLRIRTGGPMFQTEENDVLRAACIAVLSELISSALSPVVARNCRTLVHFATTSLNLETSRPVRRATAVLCYELYRAILREQNDETYGDIDHSCVLSSSLAVEMVSSGEDNLEVALRRCANARDIEQPNTSLSSSKKARLYDPATVERCKEALEARAEAERCGIMAAAKLYLHSAEQENSSRTADLVRERLKEGRGNGSGDAVTAMKGLELDTGSLSLAP